MHSENFKHFETEISRIKHILSLELPGQSAQFIMAPEGRNLMITQENPHQSAVLILLYPNNNTIYTVFIRRPDYEGFHSGQISFPGGKKENSDPDLAFTALRETFEETGVNLSDVEIIGKLTELYIPLSNFNVHPFVGYIRYKPEWNIDPTEVSYIIEASLDFLADPRIILKEKWNIRNVNILVPFFNVNGNKIWGATAMILNEFISTLGY